MPLPMPPTAERRMIMALDSGYFEVSNPVKTNADHIRSMNDEELAMCLYEIGYYRGWNALEGTLKWLQQPAEEG